jgi:hypothetical protein
MQAQKKTNQKNDSLIFAPHYLTKIFKQLNSATKFNGNEFQIIYTSLHY